METFVEKFQQDGFVVIEDFVTEEDINLMKKECMEIVSAMSPNEHRTVFSTKDNYQPNTREEYFINSGDKIRFFFEEGAVNGEGEVTVDKHLALNKIGHALHVFTPSFRKITHSEKVKSLMKCLKFADPIVMQSMYIFKQPYIGGEVTPHQDASYLFTEPLKVLGFWMALDDASAENGCLAFIPGSHQGGLYGGYRLVRKILDEQIQCVYEGEKPAYDTEKFVQVPVKKVLWFLSMVLRFIRASTIHPVNRDMPTRSMYLMAQSQSGMNETGCSQHPLKLLRTYTTRQCDTTLQECQ